MAPRDCGVVIVAGGTGSRMGGGQPKQFRLLHGRPLLAWSVEFFARQPSTAEIVVVAPESCFDQAIALGGGDKLPVPLQCVAGGARRQDSVFAGLGSLSSTSTLISVHDAARPFPPGNYEALVATARQQGGAIFALSVTDTLKRAQGGIIEESVPRAGLWAAQTPQVFHTDLLRRALEHCESLGIDVTDDAAAVERLGQAVTILEGTRTNIKVTLPEDFQVAGALAEAMKEAVP